jgi:phage shock protein PspC (stress-responsive transcriptional regulator)
MAAAMLASMNTQQPLRRSAQDRMLTGVASGLARYIAVDVLLVRIAFVVACFIGGIGIPLYLACWLLIPADGTDQSIAGDLLHGLRG